jgi:hypothetical protein
MGIQQVSDVLEQGVHYCMPSRNLVVRLRDLFEKDYPE